MECLNGRKMRFSYAFDVTLSYLSWRCCSSSKHIIKVSGAQAIVWLKSIGESLKIPERSFKVYFAKIIETVFGDAVVGWNRSFRGTCYKLIRLKIIERLKELPDSSICSIVKSPQEASKILEEYLREKVTKSKSKRRTIVVYSSEVNKWLVKKGYRKLVYDKLVEEIIEVKFWKALVKAKYEKWKGGEKGFVLDRKTLKDDIFASENSSVLTLDEARVLVTEYLRQRLLQVKKKKITVATWKINNWLRVRGYGRVDKDLLKKVVESEFKEAVIEKRPYQIVLDGEKLSSMLFPQPKSSLSILGREVEVIWCDTREVKKKTICKTEVCWINVPAVLENHVLWAFKHDDHFEAIEAKPCNLGTCVRLYIPLDLYRHLGCPRVVEVLAIKPAKQNV